MRLIASARVHPKTTALAVFLIVLAVYLVNPDPFATGDLNSNTIFILSLLEYRTVHLDHFADSELFRGFGSYSFHKASAGITAGHWTLGYPAGAAVVTAPLYVIFWLYMKIAAPAVVLTSVAFEPYRLMFSHIAGAVLSAGTVLLFFLISRRRFAAGTALIATACLAFATMQWGLLSQSLFQHNASSFVVVASCWLLLKADDEQGARFAWLAFAAGLLAGLPFLVRPTNLVFMAALLAFALLRFRARSLSFMAGTSVTFGLTILWNWIFFQSPLGASISQGHNYFFSWETFVAASLGLALSPSRGLIPNSPVLLFAIGGIVFVTAAVLRAARRWDFRTIPGDQLLFGMMLGASAILYVSYSFSPFWGGAAYGTRYLSETMPFIAYFLNHFLTPRPQLTRGRRVLMTLFVALALLGSVNQLAAIIGGQTGHSVWSNVPYTDVDVEEDRRWAYTREAPLKSFQTRAWSIRDTLTERILRGVYANRSIMSVPIVTANDYGRRCKATIVSVQDAAGRRVDEFKLTNIDVRRPYLERLWDQFSAGRKFVRVRIRNDGSVPLYGYETGLTWGFAAVAYKVITDREHTVFQAGTIYVSGIIKPGETGEAIGSMFISTQPGRYRIEAAPAINGLGYCGELVPVGAVVVE